MQQWAYMQRARASCPDASLDTRKIRLQCPQLPNQLRFQVIDMPRNRGNRRVHAAGASASANRRLLRTPRVERHCNPCGVARRYRRCGFGATEAAVRGTGGVSGVADCGRQ